MKPKVKKIKAWAVINIELGEICLTGHLNDDPVAPVLIDSGKAIFDSRAEAIAYFKTFPVNDFLKILPVTITINSHKNGQRRKSKIPGR